MEPHFVSELEHFEASFDGPYGKIISSWKRSGSKIIYNMTVPPNSRATLHLKAKSIAGIESRFIERQQNGVFTLKLKSGNYALAIEEF